MLCLDNVNTRHWYCTLCSNREIMIKLTFDLFFLANSLPLRRKKTVNNLNNISHYTQPSIFCVSEAFDLQRGLTHYSNDNAAVRFLNTE